MATHELTLDVDKSSALAAEIITARVGDTGTVIKATVLKDGAALTGAAARFQAVKPDHTYADQSASVSGNTVTVTLDPKFLSVPGIIKTAYFRLTASGKVETTPDIWINVLPDAESQAEDPTGPYVSEVESLIAQLNSIKSQMQTATNSANTAAGKANTAASSADDAADRANDAADDALDAADQATDAAAAANAAAGSANAAASSANSAAAEAEDAAAEAIAAAGMVSQDKTIFLSYDTVGDIDYLTLTDESED
ncbi:MAG TPA: hypothetical protein IAD14_04325 [Candidatus Coprousia avicola]|nr:hypothetical protein [Candidatus Coprousia avicola]